MKKKISRILGVVLTLVLLSSLAVTTAVPVSAGTQKWDTPLSIPGTAGNVLDVGLNFLGPMEIASDGTIYVGGNTSTAPAGNYLYTSGDSGRTWTQISALALPLAGPVTDIACSSLNPNTVYVTDGTDIWRSDNAGTSWSPRTNLFTFAASAGWPALGFLITSIDIGYIGGNSHIFAGVSSFGTGTGGVFVCYEWQFGMPWNDLGVDNNRPTPWAAPGFRSADVYDVRVDPNNFLASQMVMAVATDTQAGITYVTCHYDGAMWNSFEAGDVALDVDNSGTPVPVTRPYRAQLWLPSDFDASLASGKMEYHVGIASFAAGEGDVYWVLGATPASMAIDLNVRGVGNATDITGLDGIGNVGTATLMAAGDPAQAWGAGNPNLYTSINNGATWTPNTKPPTGATWFLGQAQASVVMLSATEALVATAGFDCGVSITIDGGATLNTISLINTDITGIQDLDFRADGTIFMSTGSSAQDSIWRNDGNWERVYSGTLNTIGFNPELVQSSPDGSALFAGDTSGEIYRSLDAGQTWLPMLSLNPGGAIPYNGPGQGGWLVLNANSVLVGGANVIYQTTTNGAIWFTRTATGGGVIESFDVAADGTLVAGGALPRVFISTNGGLTWTPTRVGTTTVDPPITTPVVVAFDASDSNIIYATGATPGGVVRWDRSATSPAWTRIDNRLGQPPSVTTTVTTTNTIPADSFTLDCTNLGAGDIDIIEPSLPQITVVVTTDADADTTVTYNAISGTWTIVFGDVGDIVTVTAVNTTSGSASGTIKSWTGPNGATVAIAVAGDADGDAIIPVGTLAPGQTVGYVLPDIVSTTTTSTITTTVTPYNVTNGTGLVSVSDGALYATDSSLAGAGVSRSINPTVKAAKVFFDQVACDSAVTLTGLWLTAGSNVLWSIGTGGTISPAIYTYTDTLVRAVTGTSSAVTTNSAALSWSDVPNAKAYRVYVSTSSAAQTFSTAATATDAGITVVVNNTANTASVTGLQPAVKYYWSVWVSKPVISFGAGTQSFTTLPRVPVNLVPANGAQDMPLLPSFGWDKVPGAVSYDFELGTAPDFSGATQVSTTTIFLTWETELPYDTNHYWRVRAIGVAGPSAWCESNFHTMAEPVPPVTIEPQPTPTITVIQPTPTVTVNIPDIDVTVVPPDIIVDLPTPTITTVHTTIEMPDEVTPAYIWAIVAIGALLVIAVIILIIRTRRVV